MDEVGGSGEVLDVGHERRPRRWMLPVVVTLAMALIGAAVVAAVMSWSSRPPVSAALGIEELVVTGERPVTVVAKPPIGALATPAGASLPGVTLTARVAGDPVRDVQVLTVPTDSLAYVEQTEPVTIPAGGFADIPITMAPVDCLLAREGLDLDEAGYRWRRAYGIDLLRTVDGEPVALSSNARTTFAMALAQACRNAGEAPGITVTAARRGGKEPLETIGLIVDVTSGMTADDDRLVLTPLDGPGLRGLGSADRRTPERIPLLWLLSTFTEETEAGLTASVQVFVVRDGTAYPWIVPIPITDDLPAMLPASSGATG